jgi:acid phosphatase (class A)
MPRSPLICLLTLSLAWAQPSLLAAAQAFAAAVEPDWVAIAGTYPALGSPQSKEELTTMHWLQNTRTQADVARAWVETHPDLALFLTALGSGMDTSNFPATAALLKQAKEDLKPIVANLKNSFNRPRPYVIDPTLIPALAQDGSPSFPSKHAALGILFADLLTLLDPADQGGFAREGKLIGDDRVMAGLHWPSDDTAGQRLGKAFASYWLTRPGNGQMLQDAAAEWSQAGGAHRGGVPHPSLSY